VFSHGAFLFTLANFESNQPLMGLGVVFLCPSINPAQQGKYDDTISPEGIYDINNTS
jgi:hypothetical protein